ncbi:M3 family oligoendopeptidase [Pseudalkalibacillus berkeleyi]|uniref:M3 family oligoendopeptidase n=1 Tax=Pseudalkalibacillus berkeleyi TaxID=1069813 RepID=A0ABS9H2Y6_9BACL|nr:M3 family oligoendopeptidase [Pseudalkalibacillus berkeleyi]MCF6138010.1 M3 family oligoendopeptidase [Pseudalkalibacillus berkeleyi]
MKLTQLSQQWNLENIFAGGSTSEQLSTYIQSIETHIVELKSKIDSCNPSNHQELAEVVEEMSRLSSRLHESSAYVGCLVAQDVKDKEAVAIRGKLDAIGAKYHSLWTQFEEKLTQVSDNEWKTLLQYDGLYPYSFVLNERRQHAVEKLSFSQESLINDLAVDGYHAWSNLYDLVVGKMSIPFEEDGEQKELSVGQLDNKLSSQSKETRQRAFESYSKAWEEQEDFCSEALNHLAGFRLSTYDHRKWDSVLKEPLQINRMSQATLDTMWKVIEQHKNTFVKYLDRKAEMLGLEQLGWTDVDAPIGKTETKVSYDEAANFIIDQFKQYNPKMSEFSRQAFEKSWIEAEDRTGKRPGGFCTSFPNAKETRIFMTFSGTPSNVSTLAHELGHAYHQHVMDELPYLNQNYAMNVAETASTYAEMLVSDAAVETAKTEEERLVLLEDKIQRSVAFFMNIHARFLFETRFYEERSKGLVSVSRLNELMEEAQKEAYCDALGEYHPHFWASKLHFYITDVPFYNFPYTFGYLFSAGIYAIAKEQGDAFEDKYIALLQDTGRMTVEELAEKHLGEDLTKPQFWTRAIQLAVEDVEEFLKLTK